MTTSEIVKTIFTERRINRTRLACRLQIPLANLHKYGVRPLETVHSFAFFLNGCGYKLAVVPSDAELPEGSYEVDPTSYSEYHKQKSE